jgi:hypothetical protein
MKLSLHLIKYHTCERVDVKLHELLALIPDGGGCSASRPGRFTTEKPNLLNGKEVGWVAQPARQVLLSVYVVSNTSAEFGLHPAT